MVKEKTTPGLDAARKHQLAFLTAVIISVLSIFGTMILMLYMVKWFGFYSPVRYITALLPAVPLVFAMREFISGLRVMDELQRTIQLEALAFSLAGVCIVSIVSTMLEIVEIPRIMGLAYPVIAAVLWAVGLFVAGRKYR